MSELQKLNKDLNELHRGIKILRSDLDEAVRLLKLASDYLDGYMVDVEITTFLGNLNV